jgi:anti-sigma-K factor RskA
VTETRDCGGDAAAYVLGALEADEAEAFGRHMESCVVCRDEVAAFQQVTNALPMAAPQYPVPRALRRRVVGAVRADAAAQGKAARSPWRWPALALPRPRLLAGGLAALILALAVGLELGSSGSAGTRVIAASVGSADVRVSGSHAELVVHHLPPPPPGHIYELWLQRGHTSPAPTHALFSVTRAGSSDVGVPGDVHGVSRLMVTAEPAGGSLMPTAMPVIVAQLS